MNLSRLFNSAGLIGAVLGLASLPIHLLISHEQSVQLAGVVIAVIGAIYVGFALQLGSIRQISVEIGAACLFLGAALIGIWGNPWVIPVAYAAHGMWDFAHHEHSKFTKIPHWYPPFCAVVDWVIATGLTAIWMIRPV
ncbi:MAG: hypothetical protein Q7S99_10140 [Parvibaculum sp.]|nr:hypothetical protein [Parvibaculum sp.]|tara:strand:- start:5215 stop:5628 length:414 start_codon:yes stop_codon:yes gene_type:complete